MFLLLLAYFGGVLTILSPCILPVLLADDRFELRAHAYVKELVYPKIRDEILEDAAALGGKGFSAHFGQQRWLVSRQPALRAIFSRYGWDFRGFQTQICRWRLIVRLPKSTTSARDHDVSGMAPPSRMMRAHRSRIVANMSNMAAPICKKICRPWRTILPAV